MSSRDIRMKATDVFHQAKFLLGKTASFSKAFPEIADLRVEVEESGEGVRGKLGHKVFTMSSLPGEYVDCSNPRCYNGGFHLGAILRSMVMTGKTELETTEFCQGYEGSPKGRRKYRDCDNHFSVKVNLSFKEGDKPE